MLAGRIGSVEDSCAEAAAGTGAAIGACRRSAAATTPVTQDSTEELRRWQRTQDPDEHKARTAGQLAEAQVLVEKQDQLAAAKQAKNERLRKNIFKVRREAIELRLLRERRSEIEGLSESEVEAEGACSSKCERDTTTSRKLSLA